MHDDDPKDFYFIESLGYSAVKFEPNMPIVGNEQYLSSGCLLSRVTMLKLGSQGGVLDSTRVTKPPVHAEMVTNLVNPKSQTYSCQRRQLRTSCLNPSVVPFDWSRAYASRVLNP